MSFLSAIGHLLAGAEKATTAIAPFEPLIAQIPMIGGPFGIVFNAVVQVEKLAGAGQGAAKKAAVMQMVTLAYPKIDQAALGRAVDGLVGILNDLAKT